MTARTNWLELNDDEVMQIVAPIMDNLMQASTDIDHEKHTRDFSDNMKNIVSKDKFEPQCKDYQDRLGIFTKRELVGIFRKRHDVRVFWRQWCSKSEDEYLAFVHVMENNGKFEVVNALVS